MINIHQIAYNDCEVEQRYSKDIDSCDTLEKLKERLNYWKPLAEDAYKLVQGMTIARFGRFVKALKMERKGNFSANNDAMVILMPNPMFKISYMAEHFKAPFGCVLHRMIDAGEFNQQS